MKIIHQSVNENIKWELLEIFPSDINGNLKEQYIDITQKVHPYFADGYKGMSLDEFRDQLFEIVHQSETSEFRRFIVIKNSTIIGFAGLDIYTNTSNNDNNERENFAYFDIMLNPQHQRQGIGSEVLRIFREYAKDLNIISFKTQSNQTSGKNFCQKYGGTHCGSSVVTNLEMDDINWKMIKDMNAEAEGKSEDVGLELHDNLSDPKIMDEYMNLMVHFMREISRYQKKSAFEESEYRSSRTAFEESLDKGDDTRLVLLSREPDGTASGFTAIMFRDNNCKECYQMMTGVLPEFRGRKLGNRLKTSMLLHLRDNYPEVEFLTTGNDFENIHMREINISLGYKTEYEVIAYTFDIDTLKETLKETQL